VDHHQVGAVGRRDHARVVPVEVAEGTGIDQPLVHPGGDVLLRPREEVADLAGHRPLARREQPFHRQAGVDQRHRRQLVGGRRCRPLERQAAAPQVGQPADAAVAAGEEHRVVARGAAALGHQHRPRTRARLDLHRVGGGLGDPVHAPAAQVAFHLAHVAGHQDAALADADLAHARHHVVEQRLQARVLARRIVADRSEHQHVAILGMRR
jgi:hypothetical protein